MRLLIFLLKLRSIEENDHTKDDELNRKRSSKKDKSKNTPKSSSIKKAEEEFLKSQMSVAVSVVKTKKVFKTSQSGNAENVEDVVTNKPDIQLDPLWKKEVLATKRASKLEKRGNVNNS